MNISEIVIGERARKGVGDIEDLCRSIEDVGLLQPIVVTPEGELVAGRRRVEAFKRLGKTDIPATVVKNLDDAVKLLKAERDENVCRMDFTPTEAVALAMELEKLERPKAKERADEGRKEGGKTAGRGRQKEEKVGGNLPQSNGKPHENKTREKVAAAVGMSGKTYEKAKAVVEAAKKEPERFAAVQEKMDETGNVEAAFREIKEAAREERRAENRAKVEQTGIIEDAKFATIVIDPPWDWGDEGDVDQLGRARPTYATMPLDELKQLEVAKYADVDCHLYLWITNRSLPKGFALLEAWGFRYVTCLTWCKPHFGMGNYFRGQTEHILFGVKGSQQLKRKNVGTCFTAARGPGGHSSKPDEFYELVESCSPGPFLEMFSRRGRNGWTAWGADANG